MRHFDEVIGDVATFLPVELMEELHELIEQESGDNYDCGYQDGERSGSSDSYNDGYESGYADGQSDAEN